ncbi:Uncharacterised protein [uncultured archaeon]|nr:Uncharacterised protein [uncultured archaeon]
MWQDYAITTLFIILNAALVPQIVHGFKIKKRMISPLTGIMTAIPMYLLAIIFFTLGLTFSMIMEIIGGSLWFILLIQSIIYKNN